MGLQIVKTLLVLAIDYARAAGGQAAYGPGRVKSWSASGKVARVLVWNLWIKLTEATSAEAAEQAKAPITLPIRTDRAILGIPVAA